jgi:chemotaxis protein CheD
MSDDPRAKMLIQEREEKLRVNLMPGEYYATNQPVRIHTLLGSCVAACLYDPVNRIIGMNHFLLGNRRYARNLPVCLSEAGRYGINAMELLINDMLKLGAAKKNLRAKAFGGGSIYKNLEVKDNFICVGNVNILFIREFLTIEGIPLIAEDLGGDKARIIHFLSGDYSVHVRRFGKTIPKNLTVNERRFWLKSIETQERTGGQAEIWG